MRSENVPQTIATQRSIIRNWKLDVSGMCQETPARESVSRYNSMHGLQSSRYYAEHKIQLLNYIHD